MAGNPTAIYRHYSIPWANTEALFTSPIDIGRTRVDVEFTRDLRGRTEVGRHARDQEL